MWVDKIKSWSDTIHESILIIGNKKAKEIKEQKTSTNFSLLNFFYCNLLYSLIVCWCSFLACTLLVYLRYYELIVLNPILEYAIELSWLFGTCIRPCVLKIKLTLSISLFLIIIFLQFINLNKTVIQPSRSKVNMLINSIPSLKLQRMSFDMRLFHRKKTKFEIGREKSNISTLFRNFVSYLRS